MAIKLRRVLDRLQRTAVRIELFGVTPEFEKIYEARLTRLGDAICKEIGIKNSDGDDPMSLPECTELKSPEVLKAFARLCQWLDSRRQTNEPDPAHSALH